MHLTSAGADLAALKQQINTSLDEYRQQYRDYYRSFATADSPALRDASPTVVLIQGLGMFSFGKNKTEARIVGEFYTNAIHVMQGAGSLGGDIECVDVPQAGPAAGPSTASCLADSGS